MLPTSLLEAAGLREKKVVISDVDCSTSEFHDQLVESYPKLASGGGFEFLRCIPNTRDLELIPFETASVPRLLKQRVGNGRLYIRPIQKDLPMDPAPLELEEDKVLIIRIELKCVWVWVWVGGCD